MYLSSRGRKVLLYVVLPVVVNVILLAMYFSGNLALQRIVSPKLPPLPPDAWREFGVLENLQNLILLLLAGLALIGIFRKPRRIEKAAWALAFLCIVFVVLEEIDHGFHLRAYLGSEQNLQWFQPASQWPAELLEKTDWTREPANIHNQAGLNKLFKAASDVLLVLFFVLLPVFSGKIRKPWLLYITPYRYAILTVVAMGCLSLLTHALGDWEESAVALAQASGNVARELGSMSKNLSEFRELNLYYLLLLYWADLTLLRSLPRTAAAQEEPQEEEAAA